MKTVENARAEVLKWLNKHLATRVAASALDCPVLSVALGMPTAATLLQTWQETRDQALAWRRFSLPAGVEVNWVSRRLNRGEQPLPTHLRFASLVATAEFAGDGWPQRLEVLRARWAALQQAAQMTANPSVLQRVSEWKDVDFEILLAAVDWFSANDASGLTPRQVSVDGVQGKWFDRHHALISTLVGKADLGLLTRPTRVHFTYLDPAHHESGGRKHDSFTIGDNVQLPYQPNTVVILENKDTAVFFPSLEQAIAVEGNGDAAPRLLPLLSWISSAANIIYWGDMDSRGYEIVDRLRLAGLEVQTILMDQTAYDEYERFGTNTDEHGKLLPCRPRKPCPTLTAAEREVYENLTTPEWPRYRRIEQERISLTAALDRLQEACCPPG
ncbi:Wadjet anti-phage system protein JetD domain-containing protein [Kribbella sp. NPDC006257]|uniref:Wadjet anti-phage system protein JetD domain-containing protein n=1 Tax=Kribbella sp. NPDC006257 TaxID=3156738 RepID=UPI0033ADD759